MAGSAAAGREPAQNGQDARGMNIGAVLALLRADFPDISISKIRYLEDQGLVDPARTRAGYRKFSQRDVERLRYVLGAQRNHYLPLRVIRDHLDAMDADAPEPAPESPPALAAAPDLPEPVPAAVVAPAAAQWLTRAQLLAFAQITDEGLADLEAHGLIGARASGGYDPEAVQIARTARELARFGLEPRHLRAFRAAADREAGLVEQIVSPLRRQRGPEAAVRAEAATRELSELCVRLHTGLVKAAIDRDVP